MSDKTVEVVRIYLTEGSAHLDALLRRLHDWEKVRGVTVFRGISGFGDSGKIHSSHLIDVTQHLPIVVEFYDEPEKVEQIIDHLQVEVKTGHILSWTAQVRVK